MAALAIAELSATEARAARTGCVLCRGLFLSGATVPMRDFDAWVQLSCPAGRVLRAQLPYQMCWLRCRYLFINDTAGTGQVAAAPKLLPPVEMSCCTPYIAACEVQGKRLARLGHRGD